MFILICSSNPIESNWIESNAFQSTCYRLEENLSTVFDCPLPLELHRFWLPITCGSLFHSLANSLLLVPSFNTFGAPSILSVDVCMRLVFALYICHFALSFQMFFDVCIRKRWAKQKKKRRPNTEKLFHLIIAVHVLVFSSFSFGERRKDWREKKKRTPRSI